MASIAESLQGKTALVTGGSRGIGRATVLALARAGARVAVNYKTRAADAEAVCAEIRSQGGHAVAVQANVSIAAEVAEMVRQVEGQLGPVAILVNNAGIARLTTVRPDHRAGLGRGAGRQPQVGVPGYAGRAAGDAGGRWGRIINISSVAAQTGGVIGPHYAASKAGIHGLTHSYAALLAKEGITVNAIAPALIDTEMVRDNPHARPP